MCTQKAPNNYADQLYNRYGNIYESYLKEKVLPAIKAKQGESPMLTEFAKRWKNHKLLVRQMWKLFVYLVSVLLVSRRAGARGFSPAARNPKFRNFGPWTPFFLCFGFQIVDALEMFAVCRAFASARKTPQTSEKYQF